MKPCRADASAGEMLLDLYAVELELLARTLQFLGFPKTLGAWAACHTFAAGAKRVLEEEAWQQWVPLTVERPIRSFYEFLVHSGFWEFWISKHQT